MAHVSIGAPMFMSKVFMSKVLPLVIVALAGILTGCGSADAGTSGGDEMTLAIAAPGDGEQVDVPFVVELDSSVPLGPTESGEHHVHVFFDGDDSEYMVVESDSVEITDLPEGEHVINASLRNADHSPAGVETQTTVVVGEGGSGSGGAEADDGGIDY
jgi:hypothetical protein